MQPFPYRWSISTITVITALLVILIYMNQGLPSLGFIDMSVLQNFKTLFLAIVLEAFPFILLGVFVSAILQVFVSEATIRRLIPRNPILGILFACLLGIIFPLCECGAIPVVRRLLRKGMPLFVAIVMIIAGPILNPVVFASTYMAFRTHPTMIYSRMGLAFAVSFAVGLVIYRFVRHNPLRHQLSAEPAPARIIHHADSHLHGQSKATIHTQEQTHHNHTDDNHTHDHNHSHAGGRFGHLLAHSSDEFFEMGKYLILGAFITAVIQTFISHDSMVAIGQGEWTSHFFMMGFAYILSLCSTSDAFVASSFLTTFSKGSLLTFLVFGPMVDFKGTLMLLAVFKAKFVLILIALVAVAVLLGSFITQQLVFR